MCYSLKQVRFGEHICFRGRNQKKCFQGGKGAVAPQFLSTINFNRPEKGAGFFSPPQIFGPLKTCRQFAIFVVFCGVFRLFRLFRRFPAFSGVFRRFPVFCANWRRPRARHKKMFVTSHNNIEYHTKPQTTTAIATSFPPWHCRWRLHRSKGGGGTAAYSRIAAGG